MLDSSGSGAAAPDVCWGHPSVWLTELELLCGKRLNMEDSNEKNAEVDIHVQSKSSQLQPCVEKLKAKLQACMDISMGFPKGPSQILDFLYIGRKGDAMHIPLVVRLGITHIINCVSGRCATGSSYYGSVIQKYIEFNSQDDDNYDIMQHFDVVHETIESARQSGGRCLIHCEMGINRSGALAVAYVMVHKNWGPVTAAVFVKSKRKWLLVNEYFQLQLILFGEKRAMLQLDADQIAKI